MIKYHLAGRRGGTAMDLYRQMMTRWTKGHLELLLDEEKIWSVSLIAVTLFQVSPTYHQTNL